MMKIFAGLKKEIVILIVIVTVNLVVLYGIIIFLPSWKKFIELSRRETTLRIQIKQAASVTASKKQIEAEITASEKKIDFYEKLLPRSAESSQILEEIVKIGVAANITIVSVEPLPIERMKISETEKYYIEIPIKLSLKAGYHEFGHFLNKIETAERFMKVEDINIQSDDKDINKHKIDLILIAFAREG